MFSQKGSGPTDLIEDTCRGLLGNCRDLLGDRDIDLGGITIAIPVLVTTAKLYTCLISAAGVDLDTGKIGDHVGQFESADLVRFTKTLVTHRSNPHDDDQTDLLAWARDRRRTVFIMNPSALERFFYAFRSFLPLSRRFPAAYRKPPLVEDPRVVKSRALLAEPSQGHWPISEANAPHALTRK